MTTPTLTTVHQCLCLRMVTVGTTGINGPSVALLNYKTLQSNSMF